MGYVHLYHDPYRILTVNTVQKRSPPEQNHVLHWEPEARTEWVKPHV